MVEYIFSLIIIASILFGLLLPQISVLWGDYLNPFLAILMFFSTLKLERKFIKVKKEQIVSLLLFVLLLLPLLSIPFKLLGAMTFIGVLVAFSSPSAAATAFFVSFLNGDIALALLISFLSSLLSLATLPLTIQFLAGESVFVDASKIIVLLIQVIALPIILALFTKKFLKGVADWVNRHRNHQLAFVFLLGSGIIGRSYPIIAGNEVQLLQLTFLILLALLFGGLLAYFFGSRYGRKSAVTFFIATSVKNAMLSFAVVVELFGIAAALPMVANLLAQLLLMVFLEVFGNQALALFQSSAKTR